MKYKTALLIGRFQPFHKGHLYLVKKALEKAEKLVVGIGSANMSDENNPIDYETRRKIIKAVFYKEKIEERLEKIVPLDDFFNDKKWLNNVKRQVGKFDLVVGNNEWTNKILEKSGYKVKRYPYYKRQLYEGWRIRRLIRDGKSWEDRVPDYLIKMFSALLEHYSSSDPEFVEGESRSNKFKHVVLGGTFDRFHLGHQELINKAFEIGEKVTIGISTKKLYSKKFLSKIIESYSIRKKSVSNFLSNKGWLNRAKLISFSDFKGGADQSKDIDAMVVSRRTYPNASKINELRKKNGLKPLTILIIKDVLAEDGGFLSSERIRAGEIDREGRIFLNYFKKTMIMPESLREKLRKPLGKVFKNTDEIVGAIFKSPEKPIMTVAVGDIIAMELEKEGVKPDVKIIDFRSRRKPLVTTGVESGGIPTARSRGVFFEASTGGRKLDTGPVVNMPGTINSQSARAIDSAVKKYLRTKKPQTVVIKGEEDLLAIPAILLVPLNSLVLYGHWVLGIVVVEATEKTKENIATLIKKFD